MSDIFITEVGRLVSGHPMVGNPVKDKTTKLPKMQKDGVTPQVSYYAGLAIPKDQETDWKQTTWGQRIYNAGVAGWPNGEHGALTFAWKITDGDSGIPNKEGNIPNQREGWPGHWVIHISNGFPFGCFHAGMYEPHQVIQNKNEIKTGDYVRFEIEVKGNNPSESPGVYINPKMMELVRAGIPIINESAPDATAFGATAAVLPANAQVDPNVAAPQLGAGAPAPQPGAGAPAPQPVAPAPEVLDPPVVKYMLDGKAYTAAQLKASNWEDAAIAALPVAPQ